jgi:hypothetical protein
MLDRPSVDQRLREIDDAIQAILSRLDALEGPERTHRPAASGGGLDAAVAPLPAAARGWLGFSGRTFIVLGGAFLLRALTESGALPPGAGAWLGVAYATAWLAAADRARGASALFHGVAALIVALPLVAESVARFGFFSPVEGAFALGAVAAIALGVAWHRRMRALAALALAGTLLTAMAVAIGTGQFVPTAAVLMVIGLSSLWIGYHRGWTWLAWPAAALANLAVLATAFRASASPPRDSAGAALVLLASVVVGYLGSFSLRNLFHERSIRGFEIAQTAAVLLIGVAGALAVARAHGFELTFIAVPAVVAGAIVYAQALARVLPRRGRGVSFAYYLSLAFVLTTVGVALLLPAAARAAALAGIAIAASLAASRLALPLLALHGAIAAVIATAQSGLYSVATVVWLGPATAWPEMTGGAWLALAAVAAAYALPRSPARDAADDVLFACARAPLGATLMWSAGALLIAAAAAPLGADAGGLATLKTVVLAASAVALAGARRWPRVMELGWLTYPVLVVGFVKLFVEDLSVSEPEQLVIAFVAYGIALLVSSRMGKA